MGGARDRRYPSPPSQSRVSVGSQCPQGALPPRLAAKAARCRIKGGLMNLPLPLAAAVVLLAFPAEATTMAAVRTPGLELQGLSPCCQSR